MIGSLAPELDEKTLWTLHIVAEGLKANPDYLLGANYPKEVMELFLGTQAELSEEAIDALDVPVEIEKMFRDLKKTRDGFAANDSAEKIAYFRLAISLLEKLVALKERATNLRRIGQFYEAVLQVLEEYLPPAAVTKVRDRMAELAG